MFCKILKHVLKPRIIATSGDVQLCQKATYDILQKNHQLQNLDLIARLSSFLLETKIMSQEPGWPAFTYEHIEIFTKEKGVRPALGNQPPPPPPPGSCPAHLLSGVPYVGPSNVCLHIFVVELYSFSLNCEDNKMKTQEHGNNEKSYHVNVATRQKQTLRLANSLKEPQV